MPNLTGRGMSRYTLVLRSCSEEGQAHVAQFLGKAFSLKDSTCATIASSAPIALLADLSAEQAAVCQLILGGLHHGGVEIEYLADAGADLPKIDWPRMPPIFKRDLDHWVAEFGGFALPCTTCGAAHSLLESLISRMSGSMPKSGGSTSVYAPHAKVPTAEVGATTSSRPSVGSKEFKGAHLPEITPFATPVLPSTPSPLSGSRPAVSAANPPNEGSTDAVSRLNELFPDDDGGGQFMPDNNDITSILNRLLPDEEGGGDSPNPTGTNSSARLNALPSSGYSLFLAKITDDARRQKAVPLIAELCGVSNDEAEGLSKKVIIPVLKGVSKDECEAGKQRFAKIGVLARIKGAGER